MRKKLNAMSADNNCLKSNLNQFDGKDKQQRMKIDELSQQMAESLEKLRAANKEKVMNGKKRIRFNWIINFKEGENCARGH
jgi:biotin synthase-like enzyme